MMWPAAGEIHCWLIDLVAGDLDSPPTLAADERARAARFVQARDRDRFVRSHVAMRIILARYLQRDAAQIAFVNGVHGKPRLPDSELHFNLSHSADRAALAVAADGEIGVDIERRRTVADCLELAQRYFSAAEHHALAKCPPSEQSAAFLIGWTRKEAWLKAAGTGLLQSPLNRIDAGIEPADTLVGARDARGRRFRVITRLPGPLDILSIAGPRTAASIHCIEYTTAMALA